MSASATNLTSKKDKYLFQFPTQARANYWMSQVLDKFRDEVISVNKFLSAIEFDEAVYYFLSVNRVIKGGKFKHIYNEDAVTIILNDHERTRLPTFKKEEGCIL